MAEPASSSSSSSPAVAGSPRLFRFELATPESLAASGSYSFVIVPGSDGDFGVLAGHSGLVSSLRPGVVRAWLLPRAESTGSESSSSEERWFVPGGFAEAGVARLTLLVSSAEPLSELSVDAIVEARSHAAEDLADLGAGALPSRRASLTLALTLADARLAALKRFPPRA